MHVFMVKCNWNLLLYVHFIEFCVKTVNFTELFCHAAFLCLFYNCLLIFNHV